MSSSPNPKLREKPPFGVLPVAVVEGRTALAAFTAIRAHDSLAKIGHMIPPIHERAEVQSYHKQ